MVKYIVVIVTTLDALQKGIQPLVRVVNVAPVISLTRIRCGAVSRIHIGARVHLAIKIANPRQMRIVVFFLSPIRLVLERKVRWPVKTRWVHSAPTDTASFAF